MITHSIYIYNIYLYIIYDKYNIYIVYIIYMTYIILKYTEHLLKSLVPSVGFMGDSSPAAPTRQVVSEIRLVQLSESFVSQVPGGGWCEAHVTWWACNTHVGLWNRSNNDIYIYMYIYVYICLYISFNILYM